MTRKQAGIKLGESNSLYKPEYDTAIVKFFQAYIDKIKNKDPEELKHSMQDFPMMYEFADSIGITDHVLIDNWCTKYPSFKAAYEKSMLITRKYLIQLGNTGVYHPIFCMFTAKNQVGMRDVVDLMSGNKVITPQFIAHDNGMRRKKKTEKEA